MEPDKLTDLEDKAWMREALKLADLAAAEGEVPVGAVIVKDGVLISAGRNRRELGKNALYHAELEAIDGACKALGGWRLWQCDLYVTVLKIQKRVPVGQSSIFLSFRTIISPR